MEATRPAALTPSLSRRPAVSSSGRGGNAHWSQSIYSRLLFAAIIVLLSPVCRAQGKASAGDSISFPLGGYFHPGRAMPVRWNLRHAPADDVTMELSADGAIKSVVYPQGRTDGVFPWITLNAAPSNITWEIAGKSAGPVPPLIALDAGQKLVAIAGTDDSLAFQIFPGFHAITVRLDERTPISGAPMAWQSVDALLLSQDSYNAIPADTRNGLLAAGVMLAVTGDAAPDSIFPWKREGSVWTASIGLPALPLIDPDVYAPTFGWQWGRSAAFRQRIVLLGVLFCILVGAAGLWKWSGKTAVVVSVCGICSGAFAWEDSRWPPVLTAGGVVAVSDSHIVDSWNYFASPRESELDVNEMVPIFVDEHQAMDSRVNVIARGDSEIDFAFHLLPDAPLAAVFRQYIPQMPAVNPAAEPSPLQQLPFSSLYPDRTAVIISSHPPE